MHGLDRRALLAALAGVSTLRADLARALPERRTAQADPFTLGVASGDPGPQRVVLWTRLVGPDLATLDAPTVAVRWEIATDPGFRSIVTSGTANTGPDVAHAVHLDVAGLPSGLPLFYRFHALGATSPVGRTRAAPVTADRLRLALVSCQHWEQGWFNGYRDIVAAEPDLIVHVGDYIYERSFGSGPLVRPFATPEPTDLAGYRARHALYKTDRDLQAAHAASPWLVTWDDHEVSNDYVGLVNIHEIDPEAFFRRRTGAYQAYFEHMPIRPGRWGSAAHPRLFHALDWGGLASLSVLDGRSRRDPHPCQAAGLRGGRSVAACDDIDDPERSMLGGEQEAWLSASLASERNTWTLLAQQTVFSRMTRVPAGEPRVWTDGWDGYPQARRRLTAQLGRSSVQNPIVLSGDVHCFFVNDVMAEWGQPQSRTIGTEFVTSCLASRTQGDAPFGDVLAANPHMRFKDTQTSGYTLFDIDRRRLTAELRSIDISDPDAASRGLARYVVAAGRPGAHRI